MSTKKPQKMTVNFSGASWHRLDQFRIKNFQEVKGLGGLHLSSDTQADQAL